VSPGEAETVALRAAQTNQISGYPEYASTALTSFFALEPEEAPRTRPKRGKRQTKNGLSIFFTTDPQLSAEKGRSSSAKTTSTSSRPGTWSL
jgi:glycine betaine/choline ABC-type transport system substrate-binding protein